MIAAELTKLRRYSVWVVVVVLPLLTVVAGAANTLLNKGRVSQTWEGLWSQVNLFYGLVFLSLGIAVLASSMWRMEHRGNWPRLMAGPNSGLQIVTAKLAAIAVLVTAMQTILFVATWLVGMTVFHLPAMPPIMMPAGALMGLVTALGVIAVQSLVSMLWRSFAGPIALSLVGIVIGVGTSMAGLGIVNRLFPYATVLRGVTMGGNALSDATPITWTGAAGLALPTLGIAVLLTLLSAAILEHTDNHN